MTEQQVQAVLGTFSLFARENGILAVPKLMRNEDVTRIDGYVEQYRLMYTNADGAVYEVAANLLVLPDGGFAGGQAEAEVRGLQQHYGIPVAPVVSWPVFVGQVPPARFGPTITKPKSDVGEPVPGLLGAHYDLGSGHYPGEKYTNADGKEYVYTMGRSPFERYWEAVAK